MSRKSLASLFLAFAATSLGAVATQAPAPTSPGVVVQELQKGYSADRSGLRPGDTLLSWERAANPPANPTLARGFFRTPFDVRETELEQGPRGPVTLRVLRGDGELSIRIPPARWELRARPRFSDRLLAKYVEAERAFEGGDVRKSSELWRSLAVELSGTNRHLDSAWLWTRLGMALSGAQKAVEASTAFDQALVAARKARRPDVEAQIWGKKAEALGAAHRNEEAKDAARQAVSIRESTRPESLAAAASLHDLAMFHTVLDPEFAAGQRRALGIRQKLAPDSMPVAANLANLAQVPASLGDLRGSKELTAQALAIIQKLDPVSQEAATVLQNQCADQVDRGDLAAADQYCKQSLNVRRQLGVDDLGVAASLSNMGLVAQTRGDLDRAERLHLESLEIFQRLDPLSEDICTVLLCLGTVQLKRGNLDGAEPYFRRAEEIRRVVDRADSSLAGETAYYLAKVAYQRKLFEEAETLLRQCIGSYEHLAPGLPIAADCWDDLGIVLADRGRSSEAEEHFRKALSLQQQIAPSSQDTARSRHNLGLLLWKARRLVEAEIQLREALNDLEAQRTRLGGSEDSRSAFSAGFADYYSDYVRLLMELHRDRDAFLILERSRAGSLLRLMAQRDLDFSSEIPRALYNERMLTDAEYDRTQAEIRELNPREDEESFKKHLGRMTDLRAKQAELAERINEASPHYGSLRYPRPLDLAAMEATIDPGTLLLSYSVGKEKSFLFVVSSDPKRGPALSVVELPVGEKPLRESIEAFRRLIRRKEPSPDLLARSRTLYDTLINPAEALIGKHDRLLILPDGPLHTLPWAALVRDVSAERPRYLVEWKPIHTAVSATVYAELKKSRRLGSSDPAIEVAAFGDPKYPAPVARKTSVMRGDGNEEEDDFFGDPELDAVMRGGYRFEPLPRSRQEVETIASLYAPRAETFVGEQATEERAKTVGKDVPLIHYACHAYVNERFPLDSALVFTIPDKPKEGQDNGLLQAWEIFEKVRIDADLVTLSACETGLGKEMGGEGLIGLTRAFQYAGARSVLASLWKVEDNSTAELMKRFYKYLKAGKPKDEALRLAQIDLIRSAEFAAPRDWAAFQLNGDWK